MDSKKPPQSEGGKRDEGLARRLGSILQQSSESGRLDCPDSELMAAYVERSLSGDEIAQCEDHFASCSGCRQMLILLATTAEPTVPESATVEPAQPFGAAPAPADRIPRVVASRHKRWHWRTLWLAPALGAAAVLLVWFTVRPPWGGGLQDALVAQAPRTEALQVQALPVPDQTAPSPVAPGASRQIATPSNRANRPPVEKEQIANSAAGELSKAPPADNSLAVANEPAADAGVSAVRDEQQKAFVTGQSALQNFQVAARPAPAASPAPQPLLPPTGQAKTTAEAPPSTSQSAVVAEEAPQVQTQSPGLVGSIPSARGSDLANRNNRNSLDLVPLSAPVFYSVQINGPGTTIRWRAGSGGAIQRSADSGRTWTAQMSPAPDDWLAGAAVSNSVGWLVGRKGTIARTVDGEHWLLVSPPAATGTPPDWVGITAMDAQNAMITSSERRRYATRDGGKTWQLQ